MPEKIICPVDQEECVGWSQCPHEDEEGKKPNNCPLNEPDPPP